MTFRIEAMNETMVEGVNLGRRKDCVLDFDRLTGRVVETDDDEQSTFYDCEAP
jgi:hypothetical protein